MKKEWTNPLISDHKPFYVDGDVTGGGSGQGSPDDPEVPWDWENWSVIYDYLDYDGDGEPGTYDDYCKWMIDNGFEDDITPGP